MQDFRTLQHRIAQIRATPTADEFYGQGYMLLRECAAEGQAVLQRPFAPSPRIDSSDPELVKAELKVFVNLWPDGSYPTCVLSANASQSDP